MAEYHTSQARGSARLVNVGQSDGGSGSNEKINNSQSRSRSPGSASVSDETNQKIIRMLQDDGRMPYAQIANALDISEGTVRNRVNLMKQSGALRIIAAVDPVAIDYVADAMLGIKVAPNADPEQVAERLGHRPEVVYILWVGGRYDLLAEVVFDRREDFLNFMLTECYRQSDIMSVEIMNGIAMFKNQFLTTFAIRHVDDGN